MINRNLSIILTLATFAIAGCGAQEEEVDAKTLAVQKYSTTLEGEYTFLNAACSQGEIKPGDEQDLLKNFNPILLIKGKSLKTTLSISNTCSTTRAFSITEMSDKSMSLTSGTVTCSSTCDKNECSPSNSIKTVVKSGYEFKLNILNLSQIKSSSCQNPEASLINLWKKK